MAGGAALGHFFLPRETPEPTHAAAPAVAEKKAEIWTCSMHPQIRSPKPGKCPICGMDLIPVEESAGGLRQFVTTPESAALMSIQVAPVERKFVTAEVRMVGKVTYDETRLSYITAWVPGRIDRLFVDYTGIAVRKGDHMAELYSPDLLSAQEELIQAARAAEQAQSSDLKIMRDSAAAVLGAAREKLRLWGLSAEQVDEILKRGTPSDHVTIYTPAGGIVVDKMAKQGMYVQTGTRIYTIADLRTVWVEMAAYESDLTWLRYGQKTAFTAEAYPGEVFPGRIAFISPILDPRTRTVIVRVNVDNPSLRLKPDMFVSGVVRSDVAAGGKVLDPDLAGKWICPMHPEVVKDGPGACDICGMPLEKAESLGYLPLSSAEESKPLVIPATAPLITGTRAVVYLQVPDTEKPTFEGRQILLGPKAGDYYLVYHGLREGQLVVTRGNFKIDSALQIQAKPSMMQGDLPLVAGPVPPAVHDQLVALDEAGRGVPQAVASQNLAAIRAAFAKVKAQLDAVNGNVLGGQTRMIWDEFAMLLGSDAVEGSQHIKEMKDARRVADQLTAHLERLRTSFALGTGATPSGPEQTVMMPARPAVPAAFREQLGKVYDQYRAVASALAGDDLPAARKASGDAATALAAVDMALLDHATHMAWMRDLASLQSPLQEMAAAADIEALRRSFDPLSQQLAEVIRTFGVASTGPVYRLKCPMAFGGRGAFWLQADQTVRNPYFGSAMPACGDVVETIPAVPPAGTKAPSPASPQGGRPND